MGNIHTGKWEQRLINGKWRWCCPKCNRYTKPVNKSMPPYCQWCGEKLIEGKNENRAD